MFADFFCPFGIDGVRVKGAFEYFGIVKEVLVQDFITVKIGEIYGTKIRLITSAVVCGDFV